MTFSREFATEEPDRSTLDAGAEPVLLEFGAPWCGHCQAAQPLIEAVLSDRPELRHVKIEDGRGKPLGRSFRVKLWPTLILLRQGEEAGRVVRPASVADIQAVLR